MSPCDCCGHAGSRCSGRWLTGWLFAAAWLTGKAASDTPLGTICIVIIFFISGLKLKTDEIKQTLSAWREAGFGFASILLLTPLIAFAVVRAWHASAR